MEPSQRGKTDQATYTLRCNNAGSSRLLLLFWNCRRCKWQSFPAVRPSRLCPSCFQSRSWKVTRLRVPSPLARLRIATQKWCYVRGRTQPKWGSSTGSEFSGQMEDYCAAIACRSIVQLSGACGRSWLTPVPALCCGVMIGGTSTSIASFSGRALRRQMPRL